MRFRLLIVLMMFAGGLVACSSEDNANSDATDQPMLIGSVDVVSPASGSIIYSESLFIEGTSSNINEDGFQIRLITPDDTVLAESNVQPSAEDGSWFVELVHNYTDDPTEITIVAGSPMPDNPLDYDIESIAIAPLEMRPDGTFGSITSPQAGAQVGGDSILVTGRGSGFFENTFVIDLLNTQGEQVLEIPVTLNNPYFIDDMLWELELPRGDFLGNGIIRMTYQDMESGDIIILDEVEVVVGAVAG